MARSNGQDEAKRSKHDLQSLGDSCRESIQTRFQYTQGGPPVALVLTRQNVPTLHRGQCAAADRLRQGAYVLADASNGRRDIILFATGSEVGLIMTARQALQAANAMARVVSMPSWGLFDAQPQSYSDQILLPLVHAWLVVEAGVRQG